MDLTVDQRQLNRIGRTLEGIPNALPRVVSRSINAAAVQVRSGAVKRLSREMGVKQKQLRPRVRLLRASRRKWRARVFFDHRGIPAIRLDARQLAAGGVSYGASGARQRHPRAFIATMPRSGHEGVFERVGCSRLPIFEHETDSPARVAERTGLLDDLAAEGSRRLATELDRQMGVLLDRMRR